MIQAPLPPEYRRRSVEELNSRITEAKESLGSQLVILGHHYQRDDIIQFADFRGDSFKLSQLAASRKDAGFVVFCGVHFMAESADILTADWQQVVLPNLMAGCSMADMASIDQVEECWQALETAGVDSVVPITYMNSAANLKAFVGERGGAVCTSSNARAILEWGFTQGKRVLFFPDQHLGRNTGLKMGIPLDEMCVWDPQELMGGCTREVLRRSRILLWKGQCSVHGRFTVGQIEQARRDYPGINVVVHPECPREVVQAADCDGSTEFIIRVIEEAPSGSKWAVGTEINLVRRLAREHPDQEVYCLDPIICPCSTMYRIHPAYLSWSLDHLRSGDIVNRIRVEPQTARWARVALDRMLAIH